MHVPTAEEAPPQTAGTFPHLDALRAVGALMVLTTHTAFWAGDYLAHGTAGTLLARLDVGVALFFVLSGFLLSRAWLLRASAGGGRPATGHYLWKRALRIIPIYLLTAVLALSLIDANADLSAGDRVATLLLGSSLVGAGFPAGLTHMWSLAVEVHFYLLLPLLMLLAVGRGRRLVPARVLGVLALLVAVTVWWHLDGAARVGTGHELATLQWLPAYLDWFAVGIALALARLLVDQGRDGPVLRRLRELAAQPGSCWVLASGLLLISATPLAGPVLLDAPTEAEALTKNLLYAGVGALLVLPAVLRPAGPTTTFDRLLTHPVARHLGWISYGIFCLHLPLLHLVMHLTGWQLFAAHLWAIWPLTLGLSLVAAELAYRLVERPALRLKGRHPLTWLERRRGGSVASSSTETTGTSAR